MGFYVSLKVKIKHSFEALKDIIKSGNAVEGLYNHENLDKILYIWRPIKPKKELEEIFRALKLNKKAPFGCKFNVATAEH
ncbi:MAG: hypothetical protein ACT6FF_01195 [Methanosarcinaceae archaeon]